MRERERYTLFYPLEHPLKRLYQYRVDSIKHTSSLNLICPTIFPLHTFFASSRRGSIGGVLSRCAERERGGARENGTSEKGRWREWLEEEACTITMDNIVITITPFMTINFNHFRNILLFGIPHYETTIYRIWNLNDAIFIRKFKIVYILIENLIQP